MTRKILTYCHSVAVSLCYLRIISCPSCGRLPENFLDAPLEVRETNLAQRNIHFLFAQSLQLWGAWLLHYACTCQRLTHVSGPLDRSSVSHIADMWLEAVGCLVGAEAAGRAPPSRLRLISAAHTVTHTRGKRLIHWRILLLPQWWTQGLVGRDGS